jgi:hypothetical protein
MKRSVLAFDVAVVTLFVIAAFAIVLPEVARADEITPPDVPGDLRVPDGNRVFLVGRAFGTQDYVCLPSSTAASGFAYTLFTPEATLLDDDDKQIIKHYFAPNPDESSVVRAAWQHSRDTSIVFAKLFRDPVPVPGAIPWLLLERAGKQEGPTGGDKLTKTTFIQRVNTAGGVAPSSGCASSADVGRQAFVPYTADYVFYRSTGESSE